MIEIRELHIKAVVVPERSKQTTISAMPAIDIAKLRQELITACTQRVLQKIKEKTER